MVYFALAFEVGMRSDWRLVSDSRIKEAIRGVGMGLEEALNAYCSGGRGFDLIGPWLRV